MDQATIDFIHGRSSGQQKQQPKKKKNFLLDQISTVGGIGGGILGSFISPLAGTAAGAGAGSALGEAIENAIMGESLGKNVVKEGALGAVFGAGPIKLAKGAAGGAKALMSGADDIVGAASKAALTPLRQKAGQVALGAADDLAIKNFRLTPTQLTNFQKKFGEDAGQFIRKYGFQNVDDITSKGIEPLQQQFDDAITGIAGVTKESLQKNLMKKVNSLAKAGPTDSQALGKNLQAEVKNLVGKYGDVIDAKELNGIRRQFDSLVNYTERAANPSRYGVNKRMADGIRETLQQSDPSGTLKNIGRELNKVRQLADITAKQGNLGRGSLPLGLTDLLGGGIGAGAMGGPAGAMSGFIGSRAVNSPAGRKAIMNSTSAVGNSLLKSGAKAGGQTALGIAGRQVGQNLMIPRQAPDTLEDAIANQSFENSDISIMNPTSTNAPMNAANMSESYQQTSPYSRDNLLYDLQRDPKNADKYIEYYSMLDEIFNPAQEEQKALTQGQQERADLTTALGNVEGLMGQGSINYGPIGSRVEGIKSMFNAADPETLSYKNAVSGLRAAITKARAGASLTPGELKMLAQYTPSDTDSEQVVRSKLQQLRAIYGYGQPVGGGSSLEDALMQMQGAY